MLRLVTGTSKTIIKLDSQMQKPTREFHVGTKIKRGYGKVRSNTKKIAKNRQRIKQLVCRALH